MCYLYDFFNHNDSNGLRMLSQAANGGHIGASYMLAIISIFNCGKSMSEGLMFIANMTPLKLRRCREKLRYTLFGRVPQPHLLGERPICCTVQSPHFRCELCRCDLEIDEENACNFFRWRYREDVDIRSKFVILRLANIIKELEIDDENHIKRSNKWVMKEKKTKCCNNWKLIFVLFVVAYVATDDPYIGTYETYVAIDDPYVAIYETYVTRSSTCFQYNITYYVLALNIR
ncbi:hypothetical protein H5410_041903 [Solanum commersonii]|uniref:At2g35280-like TPR domain-containing protein n=1 Tax=Solanum commersonii TaxID=4109 RepID=A0A9J5XU77_SOLCO|nr:hypothetical protein H5410_041903 [Solanum commersonii]